jgi:hypothetical protein
MNLAWILCGVAACGQGTPTSGAGATAPRAASPAGGASAGANAWTANGATACEKYLTPDVLAAILRVPAERPQRVDANSCQLGMIYISLKVADIDAFRQELPMIAYTHPLAGVGDAAYWNAAGAVSAVKGHDRGCDIAAMVESGQFKIRDAELAQKLGAICNKLFALP